MALTIILSVIVLRHPVTITTKFVTHVHKGRQLRGLSRRLLCFGCVCLLFLDLTLILHLSFLVHQLGSIKYFLAFLIFLVVAPRALSHLRWCGQLRYRLG